MIRHTVAFTLVHPAGSEEERKFLEDAMVLASIPGVENFERSRQISKKNTFQFLFSMEFENQAAYENYNVSDIHVAFVRDRWRTEVADFLEGDYVAI